MFIFKKKKIAFYLQGIPCEERTAFESLLTDYLDGSLKRTLQTLEISKIGIHVDWHDDYKCIGVQGKYYNYYMDLQIFPKAFTVSFDLDEADDDEEYTLTSKEQLYRTLSDAIARLK